MGIKVGSKVRSRMKGLYNSFILLLTIQEISEIAFNRAKSVIMLQFLQR